MMDSSYQQPPHYPVYEQQPWSDEYKPAFAERESIPNREEGASTSASQAGFVTGQHSRKPSMKVEDEYPTNEGMWHDRSHEAHFAARHYSQPSIPTQGPPQPYVRVDPNFAASYAHPQPQWPVSHSGTSTPTPVYHGSVDSYGQPVQYAAHPAFNFNQDPASAISMSPQSSQGGWASATSSDGMEQRGYLQSPVYEPVSPQLVLRPDGIRKKNARFEIPKERNLQTIDALIMASTDDNEKKELKQQKRLLRNRQAALDSRQRKKTHTEKLEIEKKLHEKQMNELEQKSESIREHYIMEREQWNRQRHHYDEQIRQLLHERDEAIRQKAMEAAESRRQINALKEYIREQAQRQSGYAPASEMNNMASDFGDFALDDEWENEFSLIDTTDLPSTDYDHEQRQVTPKPSTMSTDQEQKPEFSWSSFYMCLLFGAVVVSAGGQLSKLARAPTDVALPNVSANHQADAENVLKRVLSSTPQSAQDLVPTRSAVASGPRTTISGSEFSTMSGVQRSNLDRMSSTLTTPSRQQEVQQIFAMTPQEYNHIVDPLADLDDDADADLLDSPPPRPSRLEQAMAAYNADNPHNDKTITQSRLHQRSALHVPDSIMNQFRDFVAETQLHKQQENPHHTHE